MTHSSRARFEGTRLFLARRLLRGQPIVRLAIWLVPKNHPWRWFYESQSDVLDGITDETLKPRPRPLVLHQAKPMVSPAVRRYAAASWIVFYLAVADFVSILPGPGLVEPDPITPSVWLGITEEPVNAPSIPEMIRTGADAAFNGAAPAKG